MKNFNNVSNVSILDSRHLRPANGWISYINLWDDILQEENKLASIRFYDLNPRNIISIQVLSSIAFKAILHPFSGEETRDSLSAPNNKSALAKFINKHDIEIGEIFLWNALSHTPVTKDNFNSFYPYPVEQTPLFILKNVESSSAGTPRNLFSISPFNNPDETFNTLVAMLYCSSTLMGNNAEKPTNVTETNVGKRFVVHLHKAFISRGSKSIWPMNVNFSSYLKFVGKSENDVPEKISTKKLDDFATRFKEKVIKSAEEFTDEKEEEDTDTPFGTFEFENAEISLSELLDLGVDNGISMLGESEIVEISQDVYVGNIKRLRLTGGLLEILMESGHILTEEFLSKCFGTDNIKIISDEQKGEEEE